MSKAICKNCGHDYYSHSAMHLGECQDYNKQSGICGCTEPEPIEVGK